MAEQRIDAPTPRTDAASYDSDWMADSFGNSSPLDGKHIRDSVDSEFARELERETVALHDRVAELEAALRDLVEIERRDNLTDPAMCATDSYRKKCWKVARDAIAKATK